MTEELKKMMEAQIGEESSDNEKYLHMATMADEDDDCHLAGVLRDIAHEEKTHHCLLKHFMHGD